MMRKLYWAALTYMIVGVLSGMFTRYYLKAANFDGESQLNLLHFHILVLGMLVMLVWLALEATLKLSKSAKWFKLAFWHYNAGVVLTLISMVIIGIHQASGATDIPDMYAGVAGLGHIILAAGFGMFFYVLLTALPGGARKD